MTLSERLNELMAYHRFDYAKLAKASGVEYNTIRRISLGMHRSVKLRDAVFIARAFGMRVDDFIKGIDEWDIDRSSDDVDDREFEEASV